MTKVVSEKQKRANRQNARKSTGPKTTEGKTRTSRNALKYDLLARDVVLTGTDHAEHRHEFDALLADLRAEIQPDGIIEETLVERIATCYWRLSRVQRFEIGAIRGNIEAAATEAPNLEQLRSRLEDAERALATERRLAELVDKPADRRTQSEARELESSLEDFRKAYCLPLLDSLVGRTTPPQQHKTKELGAAAQPAPAKRGQEHRPPQSTMHGPTSLEDRAHQLLPNLMRTLQNKVDHLRAEYRSAEYDYEQRRARLPFIAALPDRDALLRVVRYENMLDRQIHRALAELRRRRSTNLPADCETRAKKTNPSATTTSIAAAAESLP